jgi:hypothetical protein
LISRSSSRPPQRGQKLYSDGFTIEIELRPAW